MAIGDLYKNEKENLCGFIKNKIYINTRDNKRDFYIEIKNEYGVTESYHEILDDFKKVKGLLIERR